MNLPPTSSATGVAQPLAPEVRHTASDQALMDVARKLEASFLSEMLRHAGLGEARESFGGGIGEAQFSSFLREIQAEELSRSGGLGLTESLFHALKRQQNG